MGARGERERERGSEGRREGEILTLYLLYRVGQHLGRGACGLGAILIRILNVCVRMCVRMKRGREVGKREEREVERRKRERERAQCGK